MYEGSALAGKYQFKRRRTKAQTPQNGRFGNLYTLRKQVKEEKRKGCAADMYTTSLFQCAWIYVKCDVVMLRELVLPTKENTIR
jgi:hypothetical protein